MSERKKTAYTPNMETPTAKKKSSRGTLGLVLSFLLPPIGIAFLWRRGVFRTRGRLLITAIATLEMALVISFLLPTSEITTVSPMPVAPVSATVAPNDGVVTALSNMDQLLAEKQAAEAALNGTPEPENEDAAAIAQHNAQQQAILQTYVYSVFNNAKLYHSKQECETQTNRRTLTVQEAMNEGMGACPNCDPPVFSGFQ
ncbi:MAG: hypothetical protein IJ466_01150 [Clostridia bacterium]|nr:hypothetical protein [Clostridia bacterium]